MTKRDLLLEIGLEEIPARFILDAVHLLRDKLQTWLTEQKLEFNDIVVYSTPRRLAVLVKQVADAQPNSELEVKGPAKKVAFDADGNWSKAAIGFSKSQGMNAEDIYFKEIKGIEYAHVKKFVVGKATIELLPDLKQLVTSLHFPNHMRWGNTNLKYVRPIRWIVALYGNDVIPFTIANIGSGDTTYGHRFLGQPVKLSAPDEYEQKLLSQYVIAKFEERQQAILDQITKIAEENQWVIPIDDDLLLEVTNLVEYPTVFYGTFHKNFLDLPAEVLITSMKSHQRYFPVKNKTGELLPFFIAVRNGDHRNLSTVIKGNEKVLGARLSDADFFYHEDQNISIAEALTKLKSIVYHEKMGSVYDKVSRIKQISKEICNLLNISAEQKNLVNRAAEICKFDLVTNMVDEFPELQGVMGEKYSLIQGEQKEVAQAIKEHYQPIHPDDDAPESVIGAIVSIADKIDSIVSSFSIGLIPTGSQDPYGLRRQAAGIIKVLMEKNWNFSLSALLKSAIPLVDHYNKIDQAELYQQLESFFKLRLNYVLQEKGIRYDIIEAVLAGEFSSIPHMIERALTLQSKSSNEDFKKIIESLSRVLNIAVKAGQQEDINPHLFENDQEKNLYEQWQALMKNYQNLSVESQFDQLANLEPTISDYFDHTMVMAENENIKANRLAQMRQLAHLIQTFAAMNKIIVK